MNTFRYICFVVTMISMVTICYAQQNLPENKVQQIEISEVWQQFLTTISEKDTAAFKELSGTSITCYDCLENTEKERTAMKQMRMSDADWYERIYDDMIFVPIAYFIAEDFDLIFTPAFVQLLKAKKPNIVNYEVDDTTKNEVLITTIEPSEEFEGMQHAFEFKKIDGFWKFVGLSTIP